MSRHLPVLMARWRGSSMRCAHRQIQKPSSRKREDRRAKRKLCANHAQCAKSAWNTH